MKKLLWRPGRLPRRIHLLIMLVAVLGLVLVETHRVPTNQPWHRTKVRAAQLMKNGVQILRQHHLERFGPIDAKIDPTGSGLIGVLASPITSTTVDIDAKLTTINPNWAAVIVEMLKQGGVRNGSTIAVSFTGSFPGINLAVLSAARAMDLRVIAISSVASSTWGANRPDYTWLDMESVLLEKGFIAARSAAASLGGVHDAALGISERGRRQLREAIRRNGLVLLEIEDLVRNIESRMEIYQEQAAGAMIAAFINVGGGTVSVGSYIGKRRYRPGLTVRPTRQALRIDSLMTRFARLGVPVINLTFMKRLARRYGLPVELRAMPRIGSGVVYKKPEYNRTMVYAVLGILALMLFFFVHRGIGHRLFPGPGHRAKDGETGHMV